MGYKVWTEEDIATLKELAGKLSAAQIAQRLGRGYAATIFKAHHLKLSLRRRPATVQPSEDTSSA